MTKDSKQICIVEQGLSDAISIIFFSMQLLYYYYF